MDTTIEFFNTTIAPTAINAVSDTLRSTRISAGAKADLFETNLTKYGLINPVTVNSGTVTMQLALLAAGVGPGDEVIISAQTFIATGMAVLYVGAKPVFADIDLQDGNMSVKSFVEKITSKTKAVIPVHWAGYPCDMDSINFIANSCNIAVIEDAAHAFGATYNGHMIGSISRFTSFSFQAIKHLTTGDGGALCCKNDSDAKLIKRLRWFDIDRENTRTGFLGERVYDAVNIGYKYHMNDIAATLGIENLKHIDMRLNRVRTIAKKYESELKDVSSVKLMQYQSNRQSSYWLFPLLVEDRDDFIKHMQTKNIPVSVVHQGIDDNSIFGGMRNDLPNQRKFDAHQIHIPIHDALTDKQIEIIIKTIKEF